MWQFSLRQADLVTFGILCEIFVVTARYVIPWNDLIEHLSDTFKQISIFLKVKVNTVIGLEYGHFRRVNVHVVLLGIAYQYGII